MHVLSIIIETIKLNLKRIIVFRANFMVNVIDSIVWFVIVLLFFDTIYNVSDNIAGWKESDIYILIATSEIIKSLLFMLFIDNLPEITYLINEGTLDNYIIKPYNTKFLISFKNIDFGNFASIVPAVIVLVYALYTGGYNVNIIAMITYLVFLILSVILLYLIWSILTFFTFWINKFTSIHEVFLEILAFNKYPLSMYKQGGRLLYSIVFPIVITTNITVITILSTININLLTIFLIIILLFYFIFKIIWSRGLKIYNSASK